MAARFCLRPSAQLPDTCLPHIVAPDPRQNVEYLFLRDQPRAAARKAVQ